MAKKDKKTTIQNLSEQVQELRARRNYLSRMIKTLDEKNIAAKKWITANTKGILTQYQQISKALDTKNDDLILKTLQDYNKSIKADTTDAHSLTLGVCLDIKDRNGERLADRIRNTYKNKTSITSALESAHLGIPAVIFDTIDAEAKKDLDSINDDKISAEKKENWWGKISGQEKKMTKSFQASLQDVKAELLEVEMQPAVSSASSKSLFQWADALVNPPEDFDFDTVTNDNDPRDEILIQAQDAEFIIRVAQNDLNETLRGFVSFIEDAARTYVDLSDTLDNQKHEKTLFKLEEHIFTAEGNTNPLFYTYISWLLENKDQSTLQGYAYAELGMSELYLDVLKLIADSETPHALFASEQDVYNFMNDVVETLVLTEDSSSAAWSTVKDIFASLDLDYTNALLNSGVLMKVHSAGDDHALKMVDFGKDTNFKENITNAQALIKSVKNKKALNVSNLPQSYALALHLDPVLDAPAIYLNNPDIKGSAKSYLELLNAGIISEDQKNTDLKTILENACTHKEWRAIIKDVYNFNDAEFETLLTKTLLDNTEGKNLFDQVTETDDVDFLKSILSLWTEPVARANLYVDAANFAHKKDLSTRYKNISRELDGVLLEYQTGQLLKTADIANIHYDGKNIHVIANGYSFQLPEMPTKHTAQTFRALERSDDLSVLGKELLNTKKINLAELNDDGNIDFIFDKIVTKIEPDDADEFKNLCETMKAQSSDHIVLQGSIINLKTLTQIFVDQNDETYFIFGDRCSSPFTFSETEKKELYTALNAIGPFTSIGSSLYNTNTLNAIGFDTTSQTVFVKAGGATYGTENKIRHYGETFSRFEFKAPQMSKTDYQKIIKSLNAHGFINCDVENIAINKNSIDILKQIDGNTIEIIFQNNERPLEINTVSKTLFNQITKSSGLTQFQDTYINARNASNVYISGRQEDYSISIGKSTVVLRNITPTEHKKFNATFTDLDFVYTGSELINLKKLTSFVPTSDKKAASLNFTENEKYLVQTGSGFELQDILNTYPAQTTEDIKKHADQIRYPTDELYNNPEILHNRRKQSKKFKSFLEAYNTPDTNLGTHIAEHQKQANEVLLSLSTKEPLKKTSQPEKSISSLKGNAPISKNFNKTAKATIRPKAKKSRKQRFR